MNEVTRSKDCQSVTTIDGYVNISRAQNNCCGALRPPGLSTVRSTGLSVKTTVLIGSVPEGWGWVNVQQEDVG